MSFFLLFVQKAQLVLKPINVLVPPEKNYIYTVEINFIKSK